MVFFSSVMIVAHEHSPVLVACVWRETKARSFYARNLTSFALCCYVIGLFNKVQTDHKHKRKRMWFGCEQPFLWVEHCVTSQKTAAEETSLKSVRVYMVPWSDFRPVRVIRVGSATGMSETGMRRFFRPASCRQ